MNEKLQLQKRRLRRRMRREADEWNDVQKKDTNNRPSETRNRRKTRKKIINKTSYFL